MIEKKFCKAQDTGHATVESLKLLFEEAVPEFGRAPDQPLSEYLARAKDFYQAQGKELAHVLLQTLPGGTFDQLLCEMLQIKSSHFRVIF